MNVHRTLFSFAPEPLPLPEPSEASWLAKLKQFMISESALIAANWKAFVGCFALVSLGVADLAVDGSGWESKSIQGLLIAVIIYLFRLLIVERKAHDDKVAKLYERIIKNGKKDDDEDNEGRPQRHTRSQP